LTTQLVAVQKALSEEKASRSAADRSLAEEKAARQTAEQLVDSAYDTSQHFVSLYDFSALPESNDNNSPGVL
jgi:hypothetical protein